MSTVLQMSLSQWWSVGEKAFWAAGGFLVAIPWVATGKNWKQDWVATPYPCLITHPWQKQTAKLSKNSMKERKREREVSLKWLLTFCPYPLNTPRTKFSTKKDPMMIKVTKYTQGHLYPTASFTYRWRDGGMEGQDRRRWDRKDGGES